MPRKPTTPRIYIARINTSHSFDFTALGRTKAEAIDSLMLTLTRHGTQYRLPTDWFVPFIADAEISTADLGGIGQRNNHSLRNFV